MSDGTVSLHGEYGVDRIIAMVGVEFMMADGYTVYHQRLLDLSFIVYLDQPRDSLYFSRFVDPISPMDPVRPAFVAVRRSRVCGFCVYAARSFD